MTATLPLRRISIVMACRNEIRHIAEVVASLLAQDFTDLDWEALIADGMSTDGTREYLEQASRENPRIRLIPNPGKIVSTGLNAAIRAAKGEFILRMDAHTAYRADYCRRSVETLIATGADNTGGAARTRTRGRLHAAVASAYHSRFSTGGAPFHRPDYTGWADTVPYGCWRKETLDRIGYFDESLARNQDDELNLRLLRAGGRIWQSADIVSWYSPRSNWRSLFGQYAQYGFWKVAVIRKHRIPGSWRHLVPVLFVSGAFLLPVIALVAASAGASTVGASLLALWAAMLGTYIVANAAASLLAARKDGWALLPYLPVTFAAFHFSYGLGFAAGLMAAPSLSRGANGAAPADSLFTRITR